MKNHVKICAYGCKRRKNSKGQGVTDERKGDYPFGTISHGCCPECGRRWFGPYYVEEEEENETPSKI